MVQQQQQDEQSAVKRIKFTQDMTAKLMVWFNECKAQGLFSSSKRKDYGTAWETVFLKCVEAWPRYPWNKEAIANKYNSERKRFVAWKTLLAYSGVSYDWAAHLPVASEATWQQFFARYNTSSRSILWLRNQPLGDERVYESVFWREMATGEHIFEAGDATQRVLVEFSQRDTQDLSDGPGSSDSGRDNSLMLDSESSEDEVIHSEASQAISQRSSAAPASARRLTPAQQRRRETDPDITPASGSQPAVTVPPSNQRRSRDSTTESEAVVMGRSMREAAAIIAGLPGARDLALAVEDLQAEFVGKISGEEMLFCCEYLRKEPMMAAMWLKLSPEIKRLYVERWKIGPLE
ncbi:hypothetical protein B0T25DRAFT_460335 [Lasiosphaeria hispida]|uniref:Myb/SANT-like domain-containing protein n=1 Tax=Lasiosphaeria hispida TaxID=260671 RepID=A0AAJ0HAK4_9PEZI|nr:hypothetical protein B0T25DRAFT_460335 [Lasiosphaeria hispida]